MAGCCDAVLAIDASAEALARTRENAALSEAFFLDIVSGAAADAHATVSLVEKRLQSRDHPLLLNVSETYYLKCLVLRRLA